MLRGLLTGMNVEFGSRSDIHGQGAVFRCVSYIPQGGCVCCSPTIVNKQLLFTASFQAVIMRYAYKFLRIQEVQCKVFWDVFAHLGIALFIMSQLLLAYYFRLSIHAFRMKKLSIL